LVGASFKIGGRWGALAGLTPTPYDSGESLREQGINKAGNQRVRALAVEIAWAWLRFQPQSNLSQWYMKRYANILSTVCYLAVRRNKRSFV